MHILRLQDALQAKDDGDESQSSMIKAKITVDKHIDELYLVFKAEKLETKRASCTIKKSKSKVKSLIFEVEAKDPVSMKAFMNSIMNTIEIYEKIK
jgi:tRNA threonylcarbamoyladenosine modification (KEOPS) complex  Pcc1 subunit